MVAEEMPNIPLIHRVIYYFTSERLNIQADPAVLLKFAEATLK